MTNATKTLSAILFIFVALTVGVKLASHPSASKAFRGTIVNVDTARVNKMIINSPTKNKKITLQKKSHGWKVSGGGSKTLYPADHRRVSRALGMLTHLDVKAIATRNPKNYTRYKADSTGTKVLLMNGNKQLAGLIIGAPQFVSRRQFNNYVRPIGNKTVYAVNGFLRPAFSTSVNQWRNKKVWKLNRSKISAIDFKFPADSSYTIKKVDGGKWISNRDTLKKDKVNYIIRQFAPLHARSFIDSLSVSDFSKPLYTIQLHLANGNQKTLRIEPLKGQKATFEAVASGYPYVFTLNKSEWNSTVLASRKTLLKKKKK